jgi:hypothetical protein
MTDLPMPPPAQSSMRQTQSDELALLLLLCPMNLPLFLKIDQMIQTMT